MITVEKFNQVYSDVVEDDTGERTPFEIASKARELRWKGDRMPLADAAKLYASISSYNNFRPDMLTDLAEQFSDEIEATPGRENSVVVYLHVPAGLKDQVEEWVKDNFEADEIDWQEEEDTLRVWWD